MANRSESVLVATDQKIVEISWKLSQTLRGNLIGARNHALAREFAVSNHRRVATRGRLK